MRQLVSLTNTDSSMIWSLKLSKVKVVLFGLAKTMTVMFNQISLPKDSDLWVS